MSFGKADPWSPKRLAVVITRLAVVGIKTVKLGNEEMFLTSATRQVLGLDERVQIRPTGDWTYLGRPLLDIYNETYKPSDVEP